MLDDFLMIHQDEIIARCRQKVATRKIPPPTETEINHGVPVFLHQLGNYLRLGSPIASPEISRTATAHGRELRALGFSVSQVVHDYGDVCQAITELAVEKNAPIAVDDFRMLNRCLDDAIAGAVSEYGREHDHATRASESLRGHERLGFFAHELRNLLQTALTAFEVLNTGKVGISGSTGTVLHRSLTALRDLVSQSLDDVRHAQGIVHARMHIGVSGFIDTIAPAATLAAQAQGVTLVVPPVAPAAVIDVDHVVLSAVVMNLLQNAFKFTRPQTTVTLRVVVTQDRVLIEVEDECGGLPTTKIHQTRTGSAAGLDSLAGNEQRHANRTGMGLGLAFSRWGAEANNGRIYTRNWPGQGCVFIVDLPRVSVAAPLTAPAGA